jgi:hypothetical protein
VSLFEFCRRIASSTVRPSDEALDLAEATARRTSDARILGWPLSTMATECVKKRDAADGTNSG